jgi:hypothetical protein
VSTCRLLDVEGVESGCDCRILCEMDLEVGEEDELTEGVEEREEREEEEIDEDVSS